jgi:hypothetical protein
VSEDLETCSHASARQGQLAYSLFTLGAAPGPAPGQTREEPWTVLTGPEGKRVLRRAPKETLIRQGSAPRPELTPSAEADEPAETACEMPRKRFRGNAMADALSAAEARVKSTRSLMHKHASRDRGAFS